MRTSSKTSIAITDYLRIQSQLLHANQIKGKNKNKILENKITQTCFNDLSEGTMLHEFVAATII